MWLAWAAFVIGVVLALVVVVVAAFVIACRAAEVEDRSDA